MDWQVCLLRYLLNVALILAWPGERYPRVGAHDKYILYYVYNILKLSHKIILFLKQLAKNNILPKYPIRSPNHQELLFYCQKYIKSKLYLCFFFLVVHRPRTTRSINYAPKIITNSTTPFQTHLIIELQNPQQRAPKLLKLKLPSILNLSNNTKILLIYGKISNSHITITVLERQKGSLISLGKGCLQL